MDAMTINIDTRTGVSAADVFAPAVEESHFLMDRDISSDKREGRRVEVYLVNSFVRIEGSVTRIVQK
jgi:hypothetical protein